MKTAPLVTLAVPVYNCQDFIRQCVDSLLAQTFTDFELLISDNASTDGTAAICESYAQADPRVRVMKNSRNLGINYNFNRLWKETRGKYVMCTSARDYRPTDCLARYVAVLEAEENTVLCYGQTTCIDDDGRQYGFIKEGLETRGLPPELRLKKIVTEMARGDVLYGLMRTESLRGTRALQDVYGNDHVLMAELSFFGGFAHLAHPGLVRREPPTGRGIQQVMNAMKPDIAVIHRRLPWWMMLWEYTKAVRRGHGVGYLTRLKLTAKTVDWFTRRFWKWCLKEDLRAFLAGRVRN